MSNHTKSPNLIMSWDTLRNMAKTANERMGIEGVPVSVLMGIGAWTLAREVFEDRLREPFVADVAIIDGIEFYCSLLVDPPNIMIMASSLTKREIPMVITVLDNETEIRGD
jgi:hypothetical protein